MKKNLKLVLLGLSLLLIIPLHAQRPKHLGCNHREVETKLMKKMTKEQLQVVENARIKSEKETKDYIKKLKSMKSRKTMNITIPVVVHVVHDYGPELIGEYQIFDAIDQMNEDYQAMYGAGSVDGMGHLQANVGYTFALAQLDPWGAPTNGITYTASTTTYDGTEGPLQSTINWPREMYLNIWCINSSDGTGSGSAYSNYPITVDNGTGVEYWDGIVCSYWAFGRTGTAISTHYKILTHEAGHWLNLKHCWGDQTAYGSAAACNDDDLVADTPNTQGNGGCGPLYSCGSWDNAENYMDYGNCSTMFTFGQAARMDAAITSTIADRNNIWSQANMIATGLTGGTPSCYCSSSGSSANDEWIENVTVGSFTNSSGASTYSDFTGSQTINISTGQSYNVSFTPGFGSSTYAEYFKMWIDFNGDCDFLDAGELVFDAGSTSTSTVNGTINIPSSAIAGETRARVSMRYNGAPDECMPGSTFGDGEVEDYNVLITGGGGSDTQAPTTPSGLTFSNVTGTTVNLSWNASTDNVGVTGYDILSGSSNMGSSTGTSYTLGGLSQNTNYTLTVRAKDAAGNVSSSSNSVSFTTTGGSGCTYCTSGSNRSSYEHIAGVDVGSFSNTSGAANYTDFTNLTIDVSKGQSYNLTLTPGFSSGSYNEYFKMWIDFNGNCDFTDSGELVFDAGSASSSVVNGTINVPSSAITGTTRARVSMRYNAAPEACMDANTFDDGEVEDYTVNIMDGGGSDTQAPTTPTGLGSSNITQTSVQLSWNSSSDNVGVTGYDVYRGSSNIGTTGSTNFNVVGLSQNTSYTFSVRARDAAGNVSSSSNSINVTTQQASDTQAPTTPTGLSSSNITETSVQLSWNSSSDNVGVTGYDVYNGTSTIVGTTSSTGFTVTGLTQNTTYTFYVRAKDAAGNISGWSNAATATTLPGGGGSCITSFPFTESFESGLGDFTQQTGDDADWTQYSGSTPSSGTGPSGANDGSYYMYIEASTPNYPSKVANLLSPCFDLSGLSNPALDFMYHMYGAAMGTLNVQASTNGSSWTTIFTISGDQGNSWQTANVSLASFAGQSSVQIQFNGITGSNYTSDICIDIVSIQSGGGGTDTQPPTAPTNLTSTGTTTNSVSLSWNASTDNVGVTGYDVYQASTVVGTTSSTSFTVSGLSANTGYTFSIRAKDAAGNVSSASNNVNITTDPDIAPPTPPSNLSASNITETTVDLSWGASSSSIGVEAYDIYMNSSFAGSTPSTSFTVTGLNPGTSYSFYVVAKDIQGTVSNPSNTVNVTTLGGGGGNCLTAFPYTESFESSFGDWTQESGDDADWTRQSGSTPSSNTGPSGASDGSYYIYIEASSPNYPSKTANLVSSCFDFSSVSNPTLEFRYHMYGSSMGTLNVQASTNGSSWTTIQSLSGDQGNSWLTANVNLSSYTGQPSVQLRLNGTTGSSYTSDICIDLMSIQAGGGGTDTQPPTTPGNLTASNVTQSAVTLSWNASTDNVGIAGYDVFRSSTFVATATSTSYTVSGLSANTTYSFNVIAIDESGNESTASNAVTVTTLSSGGGGCTNPMSMPYTESFENGLGSWTQGSGDDTNWSNMSGGTPSSSTGPSSAAVGSYYMYVESSSPNYPGKTAYLVSPCFDLAGTPSVNFQYHMYGSSMGTLSLEASTNDGSTWTNIWSLSGDQGNSWQTASVSLASFSGSSVILRFNGLTGSSYRSDMSIDNVQVTNSPAGPPITKATTDAPVFSAYPSPNDGNFKVSLSSGIVGDVIINIFNMNGQLIAQQSVQSNGQAFEVPVNLNAPSGVYLVRVTTGDISVSKRVIVR